MKQNKQKNIKDTRQAEGETEAIIEGNLECGTRRKS
jgi:hypothetical protein